MPEDKALAPISPNPFMALLSQVAGNPDFPAENLKVCAEMLWREQDRQREMAFTADMIALQGEIPTISQRGEIVMPAKEGRPARLQSKYARFEDIDKVVKPLAAKYGFAYTFGSDLHPTAKDEILALITVRHREGHSITSRIAIPRDSSGNKNSAQGSGSSMAYGKRILLKAAFNIVEDGEDTDGNDPSKISEPQRMELSDILTEIENVTGSRTWADKWLREVFGVDKVAELQARQFEAVKKGLANKLREAQKGK